MFSLFPVRKYFISQVTYTEVELHTGPHPPPPPPAQPAVEYVSVKMVEYATEQKKKENSLEAHFTE